MIEVKNKEQEGFRDKEYLAFVSGKPCIVCGRPGEAHHYGGVAGGRCLGRKASDQYLVPLCNSGPVSHHREIEKLGREEFERVYNVNIEEYSRRLHEIFKERNGC